MKTLSAAQIRVLEQSGAKVSRPKKLQAQPKKPQPGLLKEQLAIAGEQATASTRAAKAMETQAQVTAELAQSLGRGQMLLAEQLQTMVTNNATSVKPTPYRFIIKRNRRGLIETIDAHPIMDDEA